MNKRGYTLRFGLVAIVATLVAGVASFAVAPQASAQDEMVRAGELTISPGNQGTVSLEALNIDSPGLGAWQVDVIFDPAVVSAVSCSSPQTFSFCNASFGADRVRSLGATSTGLLGDTTLASITFSCDQTGAATNLMVVIRTLVDATAGAPQPIPAQVVHGSVSCTAPAQGGIPGDVDCNGAVTSVDALLILQYEAGLLSVLPCPQNADVSGDGEISPVDALLILQHVAGLIQL